jgi:hypothetical protein
MSQYQTLLSEPTVISNGNKEAVQRSTPDTYWTRRGSVSGNPNLIILPLTVGIAINIHAVSDFLA